MKGIRQNLSLGRAIGMRPPGISISFPAEHDHGKRTTGMDDNLANLNDESLISQVQNGKPEAFEELVNRHAKRFYSIAYRFLFSKSDAEDAVQQAFLRVWERRFSWNQSKGAKFTTWFYKIVVNLCLDHNRKKKPAALGENTELVDQRDRQETLMDEKRKKALLDEFIRELPERQQLALTLCFYEGLSNHEAAEVIGVNLKALQSLIMRAKTTLKERIGHHLD